MSCFFWLLSLKCKMTKLRQKLQIPVWHEIFAGSNFCDFSSHPRQKQVANKNFLKHFSRKNLLQSDTSVNSSCTQPPRPPEYYGAFARGICKFCAAREPGICQPRASDTDAVSEYNHTEDFTGKTSGLAPLSRTAKNWRGLYRHVLDFMHVFLHCLSSRNYIAKSGAVDVNQRFYGHWIKFLLIVFEEHSS